MSVMEKRLQLLLDQHRWELVSREAERTHRSVASVIREAIDVHFADQEAVQRRQEAMGRFLELVAEEPGPEQSWAEIKDELLADDETRLDKKAGLVR